jgi:organic radical activating enzyme
MNTFFVRKPIPHREIESYSILHLGTQKIFLNESGTKIWNLISGHSSAKDIALTLASGYGSATDLAESFTSRVEDFLNNLYYKGLLWNSEDGSLKEFHGSKAAGKQVMAPSENGDPARGEKAMRRVQEECMTLQIKEARTLSEQIEKLYWDKRYIYKMHLELTYRCNFRCVHCYNPTHGGGRSEMTTAEWVRALDQLAALGCYLITFTGGELFVRKDVVQILQAARHSYFD